MSDLWLQLELKYLNTGNDFFAFSSCTFSLSKVKDYQNWFLYADTWYSSMVRVVDWQSTGCPFKSHSLGFSHIDAIGEEGTG